MDIAAMQRWEKELEEDIAAWCTRDVIEEKWEHQSTMVDVTCEDGGDSMISLGCKSFGYNLEFGKSGQRDREIVFVCVYVYVWSGG